MLARNRLVRIQSLTNQTLIADKCIEANSFLSRLQGLIGRKDLALGEAMLFPKCREIHMWFMSIPIDVVFLRRAGAELSVTSLRASIRPWKALPVRDGAATDTLELPAGTIARLAIRKGDRVCIA